MKLTTLSEGDIQIIFLDGRMDLANSMKTESRLNEMLGEGVSKIIIDFEKLEYLSSSGLRAIISLEKKLKERGGKLVLASMSETVENLFNITRLYDLFAIRKSLSEALAVFREG
ncbi:MAG: STAS domain-containing protein [Syntrophaceae bacterium]